MTSPAGPPPRGPLPELPGAAPLVYLPPSLKRRIVPLLTLLSLFTVFPALVIGCVALTGVSSFFSVLAAVFTLVGVAVFILVMVSIFRAMSSLGGKFPDALAGNAEAVLPAAHSALRWVFRGDIRLSAYYLVGLVAEARGDFAAAADAFQCALDATPMGTLSVTRRRVGGLAAGHLALCLAGAGRGGEAYGALRRAQGCLMIGPGAFDFMDPLNAGFTTLSAVEPGRDPRAVVALAGVVTAWANGAHKEALDIITRDGQALYYGLLPRERALVAMLDRRTRAALDGGGVMRGAAELAVAPASHDEAWAARYLSQS